MSSAWEGRRLLGVSAVGGGSAESGGRQSAWFARKDRMWSLFCVFPRVCWLKRMSRLLSGTARGVGVGVEGKASRGEGAGGGGDRGRGVCNTGTGER
jgi:hypothetical protein